MATSKDRFAYCSTLSIYICDATNHKIECIITGHEGTICCIDWNQLDDNLLASTTSEKQLYIWTLHDENAIIHMALSAYAISLQWSQIDKTVLFILSSSGNFVINSRGHYHVKYYR